jgi:OmpA-OmpF porin, OOP family
MKKLSILCLLAIIIPGCGSRKKAIIPAAGPLVTTPVMPQQPIANTPNDEELKAFELEQNENPFNSAAPLEAEEATPAEEMPDQDRYASSSQLGLQKIYYNFNDPKVREDQLETVNKNLKKAKELVNKNYEIVVEGHACDSAGSRDYNMHLSEARAEGVADHFVRNGLDPQYVSTVGRGSEMLVVPEGTKEQQAPNRRVEVYAYPKRPGNKTAYKIKS